MLILCCLLSIFLGEDGYDNSSKSNNEEMSYKMLIPLLAPCLKSTKAVETDIQYNLDQSDVERQLLNGVWERLCASIAKMLSPIPNGSRSMSILHAVDLVEIVNSASQYSTPNYSSELCAILSAGASKCLYIIKLHDADSEDPKEEEFHEEMLNLFRVCFANVCQLEPQNNSLLVIAKEVLSAAHNSITDDEVKLDTHKSLSKYFNIQACALVCQVMQDTEGMERVCIAIFPLLCQMIIAENSQLRQAASVLLSRINLVSLLEDTQGRCERAEDRAKNAENSVAHLSRQVEKLMQEKEALERQLAFLG
jgi:uncharacterized protein YjaG (DUF416 family)